MACPNLFHNTRTHSNTRNFTQSTNFNCSWTLPLSILRLSNVNPTKHLSEKSTIEKRRDTKKNDRKYALDSQSLLIRYAVRSCLPMVQHSRLRFLRSGSTTASDTVSDSEFSSRNQFSWCVCVCVCIRTNCSCCWYCTGWPTNWLASLFLSLSSA